MFIGARAYPCPDAATLEALLKRSEDLSVSLDRLLVVANRQDEPASAVAAEHPMAGRGESLLDWLTPRVASPPRRPAERRAVTPQVPFARPRAPMPAPRAPVDTGWSAPPTIGAWGVSSPIERIRFAAANRLCVDLGYDGTIRRIEPYGLKEDHGRGPAPVCGSPRRWRAQVLPRRPDRERQDNERRL